MRVCERTQVVPVWRRSIERSDQRLLNDSAPIFCTRVQVGTWRSRVLRVSKSFLQFAVEALGVTAIAAESGHTESNAVDDYVLGRGDLTPAIISSVFSWSSDVADADRALLEWIRHYNAQPTTKRKVHFYGIDLIGGRGSRFVEARRSVERIRSSA